MDNESDKTLEQVLRETPWGAILVPLALGLLVSLIFLAYVIIED